MSYIDELYINFIKTGPAFSRKTEIKKLAEKSETLVETTFVVTDKRVRDLTGASS